MFEYLGFEPEEAAPTLILLCGFCAREIAFIGTGDEEIIEGEYTLGEYDLVVCDCGATYGEGDALDVLGEE